ncbi:hypothetical protein FNQ90_16365 [Streptomyces alkaliphilus]|uniref:Uncharacterized protein n=2 Tax=Streptomyces alkaliphilus TaxID=1472722 RepID=A0A7W3TF08_9ACTN|nr:hypothetical protein [Streptomyces alkaliphilus]MBB0245633.1 hypothetical protein [Streptomyces alkaliphilus]MQS09290.1 hypothetical protein [Streptomyces alkaliphilus]
MRDLTAFVNRSTDLAGIDIRDERGHLTEGASPVLATPAAFMAGIAFSGAMVAAYEAGRQAGQVIQ